MKSKIQLLKKEIKDREIVMKNMLRILFVNKFLYPKGGSETYIFNLADYLKMTGHQVQYFGMDHRDNIVTGSLGLNVSNMEFKGKSLSRVLYPLKIIYSLEAKRKIKRILNETKPDIIHLNNYNFQITPSILYEIKKHNIPVIMTLHDYQLICPNHMLYQEHKKNICEDCKGRKYTYCTKNKCIHNSAIKSILGSIEAILYFKLGTYDKYIDYYIAPSAFIKNKMVEFGAMEQKIKVIHNFVNSKETFNISEKGNYVLYFGRLSIQKGLHTLIEASKRLPEVNFVIAGGGELEEQLSEIENIEYVGYKSGNELKELIKNALFSLCPSEWYENCPMSVLESQMYGTPVIGADIGGIPELIEDGVDGLLFKPGDVNDLVDKIKYLYNNNPVIERFSKLCNIKVKQRFFIDGYYEELMKLYNLGIEKHKRRGDTLCQKEPYTAQ